MRKKEARQKHIKLRKNIFPTLLITVFLWIIVAGFIYFVDPESFAALPIFFLLLFPTLFFTTTMLLANTRRGLIVTSFIWLFVILRYLGVGNIINLSLLVGLGVVTEIYFSRN